jgi:hypothetical protein
MTTPIHDRVARIRAGDDPACLARTPSGFAILGKHQPEGIVGCCMLLPDLPAELRGSADPTPAHLNDLPPAGRAAFLADLALLGDAVQRATGCERLNYLILCNQVPALHGHVVPRFADEDPARRRQGPFEAYDFAAARLADPVGRDAALFGRLRDELLGLLGGR